MPGFKILRVSLNIFQRHIINSFGNGRDGGKYFLNWHIALCQSERRSNFQKIPPSPVFICGTWFWHSWQTYMARKTSSCQNFLETKFYCHLHLPASQTLVKYLSWIDEKNVFNASLKTTAQAHANYSVCEDSTAKKNLTGSVSKTFKAFLHFLWRRLWHGLHPGILSPFTSYHGVTQILSALQHISTSYPAEQAFLAVFHARAVQHFTPLHFFLSLPLLAVFSFLLIRCNSSVWTGEMYICTFLRTLLDEMQLLWARSEKVDLAKKKRKRP